MKDRRNMTTKTSVAFDAETFLTKAGKGRSIIKYRKDEIVFSQGDPANAVFYIQKGRVKITVVSPQGKEAVIGLRGADEFFGAGCLSGQPRRLATVRALAECEITRIEKAAHARLIRDEPAFSEMFMAHVLARSTRLEEDLVDQLFELLPVPQTLGLGVMMGLEVAHGTTQFQPGVQARGGAVGTGTRGVDCAGGA